MVKSRLRQAANRWQQFPKMTYLKVPDLFFKLNPNEGKEKFTFGPLAENRHLTVHFGTRSGVLDVHLKNESTGDYETILQIEHSKIIQLVEKIGDAFQTELLKEFSTRINVGKLIKYNCILQIVSESSLLDFFKSNIAKTKFKLRKNILADDFDNMFIWPEEAVEMKEQVCFVVHRIRNGFPSPNGIVFKLKDPKNSRKFIYIKFSRIRGHVQRLLSPIMPNISSDQRDGIDALLNILDV